MPVALLWQQQQDEVRADVMLEGNASGWSSSPRASKATVHSQPKGVGFVYRVLASWKISISSVLTEPQALGGAAPVYPLTSCRCQQLGRGDAEGGCLCSGYQGHIVVPQRCPSAQSRDVESSPPVARGTQNTPQAPFCPAVASSHLSLAVCVSAAPRLGAGVVPCLPAPGLGAAACPGPRGASGSAPGGGSGFPASPGALQMARAARPCARCRCHRLQFSDENQLIIFLKVAVKQRYIKLH